MHRQVSAADQHRLVVARHCFCRPYQELVVLLDIKLAYGLLSAYYVIVVDGTAVAQALHTTRLAHPPDLPAKWRFYHHATLLNRLDGT